MKKKIIFIFISAVCLNFLHARENVDERLYKSLMEFEQKITFFFMESSLHPEDDYFHAQDIRNSFVELEDALECYRQSNLYKFAKSQGLSDLKLIDSMYLAAQRALDEIDSGIDDNTGMMKISQACRTTIAMENNTILTRTGEFLYQLNETTQKAASLYLYLLIFIALICIVTFYFSVRYFNKVRENDHLRSKNEKTKLIAETVLKVQENERQRISQELHDTVTQDIRAVLLYSRELESYVQGSDGVGLMEKIIRIETANLKNIRTILKNLTPPELEHSDFRNLISDYCKTVTENTGIECTFFSNSNVLLEKLNSTQKLHLFRIIQESITNAVKHASPSELSVIVREEINENRLIFFITDDGCGFEQAAEDTSGTHLGLKGMHSRAEILNAVLSVSSDAESGTEVRLELVL